MIGPFAKGHWTAQLTPKDFAFLVVGQRYAVVAPFADFDGDAHVKGESWIFLGTALLPYDDGRSLFVSLDGQREWHIRLQDRPDQQGPIIGALTSYLQPVRGD